MKKVFINGEALVSGKTYGMNRLTYEILNRMDLDRRLNENFELFVILPSNCDVEIKFKNIRKIFAGKKVNNPIGKIIYQQIQLPRIVKKNHAIGVDLCAALPTSGFSYICIPDCIWERYPENYMTIKDKLGRYYHLLKAKKITGNDNIKILTLSEFSKQEICAIYGDRGDRITVIPCGWEHMNDCEQDDSVFLQLPQIEKGRYYFSLGSIYKHKNMQWILKNAIQNPADQYVITGAENYSSFFKKLKNNDIKNVIFTGYLSNEQVKSLMINCKALIQTSIYEGFGLPPLEAVAMGKNIILAKSCCFPEIYGRTAYYVDPDNFSYNLDDIDFSSLAPTYDILQKYTWDNAELIIRNLLLND